MITDKSKSFTAKQDVITRLAKEIKEAKHRSNAAFVLGNGAGSFGHVPANEYCLIRGDTDKRSLEGVVLTNNACAQLNLLVVSKLLEEGVSAISIAPASSLQGKDGRVTHFFLEPLYSFLQLQITPVLYGTVVSTHDKGYTIMSADTSLSYLALSLKNQGYQIARFIHVGQTAVMDQNKQIIPMITQKTFSSFQTAIKGSGHTDVTGGMLHKVTVGLDLAEKGIETWIINGNRERELVKAVLGENVKGTIIKIPKSKS